MCVAVPMCVQMCECVLMCACLCANGFVTVYVPVVCVGPLMCFYNVYYVVWLCIIVLHCEESLLCVIACMYVFFVYMFACVLPIAFIASIVCKCIYTFRARANVCVCMNISLCFCMVLRAVCTLFACSVCIYLSRCHMHVSTVFVRVCLFFLFSVHACVCVCVCVRAQALFSAVQLHRPSDGLRFKVDDSLLNESLVTDVGHSLMAFLSRGPQPPHFTRKYIWGVHFKRVCVVYVCEGGHMLHRTHICVQAVSAHASNGFLCVCVCVCLQKRLRPLSIRWPVMLATARPAMMTQSSAC